MSNRRRLRPTPKTVDRDPVVKSDGNGKPVRLSEASLDRAERRRWARNLRRTT